MEKLKELFFYMIDKTIKTHRQYTQNRLRSQGYNLTVDQWLLLTTLATEEAMTQNELAAVIFKDKASINRMLTPLIKKRLLKKEFNEIDKRKTALKISDEGEKLLRDMHPLVLENRKLALEGISEQEIAQVRKVLSRVIANCEKYYDV